MNVAIVCSVSCLHHISWYTLQMYEKARMFISVKMETEKTTRFLYVGGGNQS